MSGVAGKMIRESRVARVTGVLVELVDADHPECTDFQSEEGGRWVTICREHTEFVQHETWKVARQFLGHPEEWCDGCREAPKGDSAGDGFSEEERQRALETRRANAAAKQAQREAEKAKRDDKRDLEGQWTAWIFGEPMTDRVWLPAEKEAADKARSTRTSALEAARKAKGARRQGEERLKDLPKIKSKREQKNRDRLEAEISAADEIVVAKEDVAHIAREEQDRLARIAQIRGHRRAGWKVVTSDGDGEVWKLAKPGTKRALVKGDRVVEIPDNYLPAEDYALALKDTEVDASG